MDNNEKTIGVAVKETIDALTAFYNDMVANPPKADFGPRIGLKSSGPGFYFFDVEVMQGGVKVEFRLDMHNANRT